MYFYLPPNHNFSLRGEHQPQNESSFSTPGSPGQFASSKPGTHVFTTYVDIKANSRKATPRDLAAKEQRGSLLKWNDIRKMLDFMMFLQLIDIVASWCQYIYRILIHRQRAAYEG